MAMTLVSGEDVSQETHPMTGKIPEAMDALGPFPRLDALRKLGDLGVTLQFGKPSYIMVP